MIALPAVAAKLMMKLLKLHERCTFFKCTSYTTISPCCVVYEVASSIEINSNIIYCIDCSTIVACRVVDDIAGFGEAKNSITYCIDCTTKVC